MDYGRISSHDRIDPNVYGDRHPNPNDIFLLIEIAYSTLKIDRQEKALIYAKVNIGDC